MPARVIVGRRRAVAMQKIAELTKQIEETAGIGGLSLPLKPKDRELERVLQLEALAEWLERLNAYLEEQQAAKQSGNSKPQTGTGRGRKKRS